MQNMSNPRIALECLEAQVPDARRKAGGRDVSELIGVSSRRDKDVVMKFVLIGPEVEKDEVGSATIVNAEKPEMVVAKAGRQ